MRDDTWARSQEAYADAAAWFRRMTAEVGQRWNQPGLGEWDVRDLVGHTSRSLVTVEEYLARPARVVEVDSAVDYYRRIAPLLADPSVVQRGRDAGAALGPDVDAALATIAARVLARVRAAGPDDLLTTIAGGMRLADYLPTRTFELTVHTCDLAAAIGQPADVPETAATESLALVAGLAARAGSAGSLLLAATGRHALPAGFTVL